MAARLATEHLGVLLQTDTYFHVKSGRLKLRQIEGQGSELIWYARPNEATAKTSRYHLAAVTDDSQLLTLLDAALGRRLVVRKRREVFLIENVRVHLDEVEELGCFLEFEAVLEPQEADEVGRQQLRDLQQEFGIASTDLLTHSYADMLEARRSK